MSHDWKSWRDLSEVERRLTLADKALWSKLSERQRESLLDEGDWQEIRLIPEARRAKLDSLVSLDNICKHLGLSAVQTYWLMSTRRLSGAFLVGGTWKYDVKAVDRWVEQGGGNEAVRRDVEDQMAKHRSARDASPTSTKGARAG